MWPKQNPAAIGNQSLCTFIIFYSIWKPLTISNVAYDTMVNTKGFLIMLQLGMESSDVTTQTEFTS